MNPPLDPNPAPIRTLDQFPLGSVVTVRRVHGKGPIRRRLMDMGIVSGIKLEILRAAPMGDPIEYKLRGYHLSLRKSEAKLIEVEATTP